MELLQAPPGDDLPPGTDIYVVTYRPVARTEQTEVDVWPVACALGQPLPTMPLYLRDDLCVPLELEKTYAESCRKRRLDRYSTNGHRNGHA